MCCWAFFDILDSRRFFSAAESLRLEPATLRNPQKDFRAGVKACQNCRKHTRQLAAVQQCYELLRAKIGYPAREQTRSMKSSSIKAEDTSRKSIVIETVSK